MPKEYSRPKPIAVTLDPEHAARIRERSEKFNDLATAAVRASVKSHEQAIAVETDPQSQALITEVPPELTAK